MKEERSLANQSSEAPLKLVSSTVPGCSICRLNISEEKWFRNFQCDKKKKKNLLPSSKYSSIAKHLFYKLCSVLLQVAETHTCHRRTNSRELRTAQDLQSLILSSLQFAGNLCAFDVFPDHLAIPFTHHKRVFPPATEVCP